jgi:hypothetical protein
MNGGEIKNFDVGISNEGISSTTDNPTNIYMDGFATIQDCYYGIAQNGNAAIGLVAMNCARIINAASCIKGEDIELLIDPAIWNTSGGSNSLNPNTFIKWDNHGPNTGFYLDICYRQKTSPTSPVPASNNFWGQISGWGLVPDLFPNGSMSVFRGTDGSPCSTAVPVNTANSTGKQPRGCSIEEFCDAGEDCSDDCPLLLINGQSPTVRSRFMEGMEEVENEEYETAQDIFGEVATLWQPVLPSTMTEVCHNLVNAARSLSEGEGSNRPGERSNSTGAGPLKAWPNPASTELRLEHPASAQWLRVSDTFGRLVYEQGLNGNTTILNIEQWPSGVYFVTAQGEAGHAQALKVVVQR